MVDAEAIWRPGHLVFLVNVDSNLAGFAFMTRQQPYLGQRDTY